MARKQPEAAAEKKNRRPMVRCYVKCEAGTTRSGTECGFETKRHSRVRTAEIEYQRHALAEHGKTVTVEIELERREKVIS